MAFAEALAHKRDGLPLSRAEVAAFVAGASHGTLPPEQLAAMLMAICCRGMGAEETRWLTEEMLHSGTVWELGSVRPEVVDKHSTGGVGDTVSLVLAPLLAAVGVPIAMMAGRGLGHSQGTLDKLAAIPGFDTDRDRDGVLRLLDECGAAIAAQNDAVAPADRTLYALRDVTGTVPSLPLIVSSIMSKKLALGAATLVLDVKWGSGAFRKTRDDAAVMARALCAVGRDMGMKVSALITDMNQPLGPALGTACEVRETLAVLEGGGSKALREVTLCVAEEAMALGGSLRGEARATLEKALADGSARRAWDELVRAHGGDPDPERLARPRDRRPVAAAAAGYVAGVDGEALGLVAAEIGAGRRTRDEALAHGAGLLVNVRLGERVEPGAPLATLLLGERAADASALAGRVAAAFRLAEEAPSALALVLGTADEV